MDVFCCCLPLFLSLFVALLLLLLLWRMVRCAAERRMNLVLFEMLIICSLHAVICCDANRSAFTYANELFAGIYRESRPIYVRLGLCARQRSHRSIQLRIVCWFVCFSIITLFVFHSIEIRWTKILALILLSSVRRNCLRWASWKVSTNRLDTRWRWRKRGNRGDEKWKTKKR